MTAVPEVSVTFWVILSFSFLTALTGAMAPGPLMTYTIIKSAQAEKRGYLMGAWVITGHALIEVAIIMVLLLGFSFVIRNIIVVRIIGVVGGVILIYFGISVIRDVFKGKIPTEFIESSKKEPDGGSSGESVEKDDVEIDSHVRRERDGKEKGPAVKIDNPVLGGALVSMSNPYWWVWWATIGFAFMVQFEVTFSRWPRLLAFFIGHEAGDLAWYLVISIFAFFGLRRLNKNTYYGVLVICGLFMVFFGLWLGVTPFTKQTL